MTPRPLTQDECKERFLEHVWALVDYWANEKRVESPREQLSGLAFSIFVLLDGASGEMPKFALYPDPHPDDLEYYRENGENWWPPLSDEEYSDLAGSLHEEFYARDPKTPQAAKRCSFCRKAPAQKAHTCPFQEEIHDDAEFQCDCCEECERNCRDDI